MTNLRNHRRNQSRPASSDAGMAIPMVLGAMFVVTLLALTTVIVLARTAPEARASQDGKTAIAAANAGLDEFSSRMTAYSGDVAAILADVDSNPAYDLDPETNTCDGPGKLLPGNNTTQARFCYRVLSTPEEVQRSGVVEVSVTGSAGPSADRLEYRTIRAKLRGASGGTTQFAVLTDKGVMDPSLPVRIGGLPDDRAWYLASRFPGHEVNCVKYRWQRPSRANDGTADYHSCAHALENDVAWTHRDRVDGSIHTNDTFRFDYGAPQFSGPVVSSGAPASSPEPLWHGFAGARNSAPVGVTRARQVTGMDIDLDEHLAYVKPDLHTGDPATGRPGCLYRGITKFTFSGSTMTVDSPNTRNFGQGCPSSSSAPSPIPPIIYVAAGESGCSRRINGFPLNVSGRPEYGTQNRLGMATVDYEPCVPMALVEGSVSGTAVTVVSAHDIMVVNNVVVPDKSGSDLVSLMAKRNVWVHNPVICSEMKKGVSKECSWSMRTFPDIVTRVDAAIVAVNGSFLVQNYRWGNNWFGSFHDTRPAPCRTLKVNGAIISKYMGPTGTQANDRCWFGYLKHYAFDERLRFMQTPYFSPGKSSGWEVFEVTDAPS